MLFQSIPYLIFFPLVALGYFAIQAKWRWIWILLASYFFYMYWNPWYTFLIIISTLTDYIAGIKIEDSSNDSVRKKYLYLSIFINLGLLFTFKYFDFFSAQVEVIGQLFSPDFHSIYLELLLPIGISFYTFQTISYTIDVYRSHIPAERHLGHFALYVNFFPQLVAGPIERAKDLLSQFHFNFKPEYQRVVEGLRLILWGFFKKLVIADHLGLLVTEVYGQPELYHGMAIWIAAYAFLFQLYCDFSAYQDIAVGSARILGINLSKNFEDRVYFSKSVTQFWRSWHMTLTRWLRDYIYIPLGGNRRGNWIRSRNVFIVLLAIGLWHGSCLTKMKYAHVD
jgi:D-alanyl-lipoteichoic acid acyltransferase DltB (MBOAT superfamily)